VSESAPNDARAAGDEKTSFAATSASSESSTVPPSIETRGLGRRFDRTVAVEGLDLAVRPGEIYGFLGPNGAGKTTTMRMLVGLLRPSEGEIRIGGRTYAEAGEAIRRSLGFVPDTPPLYENLTGRQYVGFVASLWGVSPADRDARADRWLGAFGLADRGDDLCKGYSHGMRKKLHLAAVLATGPEVVFLDEPTTGLDPKSARVLKDALSEVRAGGMTVFLSTHLLDTAEELCDRIGILSDGRMKAEGTPRELTAGSTLERVFLELTDHEATLEADARDASSAAATTATAATDTSAVARRDPGDAR